MAAGRRRLDRRLGSTPTPRPALYTCPNEGLSDTVVADLEVRGDSGDRPAASIEHCGLTDLVVVERLTPKLDTLLAKHLQQATL